MTSAKGRAHRDGDRGVAQLLRHSRLVDELVGCLCPAPRPLVLLPVPPASCHRALPVTSLPAGGTQVTALAAAVSHQGGAARVTVAVGLSSGMVYVLGGELAGGRVGGREMFDCVRLRGRALGGKVASGHSSLAAGRFVVVEHCLAAKLKR